MHLSSPVLHEPPLSPGPAPAPPAPAPAVAAAPTPQPETRELSIEAQLVRLKLVSPDQIATAMREEAESGRDLSEIVVAHGWISAEDMARVRETPAAAAAPAPFAETPGSPSAAGPAAAELFIHLTNDERVEVGRFSNEEEAEVAARDLIQQLDSDGSWPRLGGRFIRPDAVVSIDVELTEP